MKTHVVFEHLGIDVTMNRRLIDFPALGGGIYYYALIICFGFLLAWLYVDRRQKRCGDDPEHLLNMILIGLPVAVISARLYYVLFSLPEYLDRPLDMFKIWEGGLAIYGGVLGAAAVGIVYCRLHKLSLLHYFDLAAVGFLIGQIIGRWGNFVNGEAHGSLVSEAFVFGMKVNGEGPFHPTFFYESVLNLIGLILILLLARRFTFDGFQASGYLIWYGAVRMCVEGLRTDSLFIPGTPIRVSQLLSGVFLVFGIVLLCYLSKRQKNAKTV